MGDLQSNAVFQCVKKDRDAAQKVLQLILEAETLAEAKAMARTIVDPRD